MDSIRTGLVALAAAFAPCAGAAVSDGGDCGGFTAAQAAAWLKAPAAQVTREVSKSGDKWMCSFAVGKSPAIEFSLWVASNARRATADLERSLDRATVGLVTAALIVGSSMLVAASASSDSFAMRFFGALGVGIAFVNSAWLLFAIRRAHREPTWRGGST